MISLTRLNHKPLVVNSDMIKFIENTPDTVLTLVTGEKVVVLETVTEVLEKVVDFRRQINPRDSALAAGSGGAAGERESGS